MRRITGRTWATLALGAAILAGGAACSPTESPTAVPGPPTTAVTSLDDSTIKAERAARREARSAAREARRTAVATPDARVLTAISMSEVWGALSPADELVFCQGMRLAPRDTFGAFLAGVGDTRGFDPETALDYMRDMCGGGF